MRPPSCARPGGNAIVGELGLSCAEDTEIVKLARNQRAVIVTLDADFHALPATSGASRPSVIRIRLQGLEAKSVAAVVVRVMGRFPVELEAGCLITVKLRRTTCHMLPTADS
jgi:predicted nuclease of predicted toxin-antitoxin system